MYTCTSYVAYAYTHTIVICIYIYIYIYAYIVVSTNGLFRASATLVPE